jgi:nucleoside-diphosphate kinase
MKKKVYGKIIQIIEEQGFSIVNMKMMRMDDELIAEHYSHLTHLDFFPELSSFMQSGPVLAIIVEGENAVAGMRAIMGPTKFDPIKSQGTIRGQFADSTTRNIIHGSDSIENAEIEIKRFFGNN